MHVTRVAIFGSILLVVSGCRPTGGSNCIANLKTIEAAKACWALEGKKAKTDTPTDADLFGMTNYIREKPICSRGGVYTIGSVTEPPRCSIPEHDEHWSQILDTGKVYVFSESCVPLEGATVQDVDKIGPFTMVKTDTNGLAHMQVYGAKEIVVSKAGYSTNTFILPPVWPFRLVLMPQLR